MRLLASRIEASTEHPGSVRLAGEIRYDTPGIGAEEIWFEVPESLGSELSRTGNPWLACMGATAALLGEDLELELPVDSRLRESLPRVFSIWKKWYPELHVPKIAAETEARAEEGASERTACFFSGGVDSFFTALDFERTEPPGVDDLLCVWGFDVPLSHPAAFERIRRSLSGVAEALGKGLVPVATNLRSTQFGRTQWAYHSHGSALASVALALEPRYRRALIGSTLSQDRPEPWGSHFSTDPLFSTRGTRVVHYGAEFTRTQKTAVIAGSKAAWDALRVCWRDRSDRNCGACEKCFRTMTTLHLLGALDRFRTFPRDGWRPTDIGGVHAASSASLAFLEEIRTLAESKGDAEVARAVGSAVRRSRRIHRLRAIVAPLWRIRVLRPAMTWLDRRIRGLPGR